MEQLQQYLNANIANKVTDFSVSASRNGETGATTISIHAGKDGEPMDFRVEGNVLKIIPQEEGKKPAGKGKK